MGSGFLKLDDFRRLLDSAPAVALVELSNYGEVFLNPQLLQIMQCAHQRGVALQIGNGANFNNVRDEVIEGLVRYGVRTMTCSIDGASPETYRKYRVRGDFDAVIRNIEKLNACKSQFRSKLPHLVWQFVVFGHNEHELPAARAMAARLDMVFVPKVSWDPDFSPIRDSYFVRAQTGANYVTRQEYEAQRGER